VWLLRRIHGECVSRKMAGVNALERLSDLFALKAAPNHIRSDNGGEITTKRVGK
jgi:hypothetical protein